MSRTYRLLVSCDENGSTACHGVLEYRVELRSHLDRLEGVHRGWHTGLNNAAPGTPYDVCPACWPAVERRLHEWGRPVADDAPSVLDAVQLRALGAAAAEPE